MATKADLHRLIDELPDELVDEAAQRLEELGNPLLRALLAAPAEPETDDEPTVTLYHPVGQKELDLISESGYRRFPPAQQTGEP